MGKEPWARVYEGLMALVLEHRHEYGRDIAKSPVLANGVAAILRGLEVLLDADGRSAETTERWVRLDRLATFAGWDDGLEGAEQELWKAPRQPSRATSELLAGTDEVLYPILEEIEADSLSLFAEPKEGPRSTEGRPPRRIRPGDWV